MKFQCRRLLRDLINTGLQPGGERTKLPKPFQRLGSGAVHVQSRKTVKTVFPYDAVGHTRLKPGVNEIEIFFKSRRNNRVVTFGLTVLLAMGAIREAFASDVTKGNTADRIVTGRTLFLKNCAHCHADDAAGDEGPDLHGLKRPDDWIARRIRNGVKGEMTAFGEKFSQDDIDALIRYLRTLK
jgi:mono/diheme cytochrome c family protein